MFHATIRVEHYYKTSNIAWNIFPGLFSNFSHAQNVPRDNIGLGKLIVHPTLKKII
jgi:hypothetical protein